MTDAGTKVERRCEVLLGLATSEDAQGHRTEARELFAAAICEARRSDRPELLSAVRRACAGRPGTSRSRALRQLVDG